MSPGRHTWTPAFPGPVGSESGTAATTPGGSLPAFSKALGLDLIIDPHEKVTLVELQNHFGRRGLMELYPNASRKGRKLYRRLRLKYGINGGLNEALRRICTDKILTYRTLPEFQPLSMVFSRWSPAVRTWLKSLDSEYILSKPPRGSCGRGIGVYRRSDFQPASLTAPMTTSLLLQEYVFSKALFDRSGGRRVGCIRHIVLVWSDTHRLHFLHFPSYWRISPAPLSPLPERAALTANISRGAFPLAVSSSDSRLVRAFSEKVIGRLTGIILKQSAVPLGPSRALSLQEPAR